MLQGFFQSGFCNFVESKARSGRERKFQNFGKVPRNRLAFAVLIGREIDIIYGFYGFFQLGDGLFVFWVDFVSYGKIVSYINLNVFSNVPNRGQDAKIGT